MRELSRVDLAERLGLVKSGRVAGSTDSSGVTLPQAFLTVRKRSDGRLLERSFLGHFETIQYLEDCGILIRILTGELCAHYRNYLNHIFYRWCKPLEQLDSNVEICSTCHLKEESQHKNRLVFLGNFLGGHCPKTHDLSIFFEHNKVPYNYIDPANSHLDPSWTAFVKSHDVPREALKVPRIWINNIEVSVKQVHEFAMKGLLIPILRGHRC